MTAISVALGQALGVARAITEAGVGGGPLAMYNRIAALSQATDTTVAFTKISSSEYHLFRPMDDNGYWAQAFYRDGGISGGPLCWNGTRMLRVLNTMPANSASVAYTGAWSTAGSANPAAYVGGVARYTTVTDGSRYLEVTFDGPGDLYVVFTGRTTGSYWRADVDGSTENANELPSNGTYRYIDTYTATDLQYKQVVKVASGLAAGSHTLRLTPTTDRNPANTTGFITYFEAAAIGGDSAAPGMDGTDAPLWEATTAVAQFHQIRTSAGRYYGCTVAGTTGGTEPTHTSGTATDGTVTWQFMASSSYATDSHTIQVSGSELEYAYQIKPDGASSFEDVGGILHGNEQVTSKTVSVDGVPTADGSIPVGAWLYGDNITVTQTIETTHSETGATVVVDTEKSLITTATDFQVQHSHTFNVAAEVGWFYTAMWPLLNWGAVEFRYCTEGLWTQGSPRLASDYYGVSNPVPDKTRDYVMAGSGEAFMPAGAAGVASSLPAKYQFAVALYVTPESVDNYSAVGDYYAAKAMNLTGGTPPGFSSVSMKMYFERRSNANPAIVAPAEEWNCAARYAVSLAALDATLPFPLT